MLLMNIVLDYVICVSLRLLYFVVVSPGFDFVFSVKVKRLAGQSIFKITCFVASETLNVNLINQSMKITIAVFHILTLPFFSSPFHRNRSSQR